MDQDDTRDIADLCKPLSAKVMPRSAMISHTGQHARSEAQALRFQRGNGKPPRPARRKARADRCTAPPISKRRW